MKKIDQTDLLDFLIKKDNRAYQWLYSLYFVALKSLAVYYVKDEDIANDMVQDTFISLLEYNKKFQSISEVKYFLYVTLKNKCISQLRKIKVRDNAKGTIEGLYNQMSEYWNRALEEDVYSRLMEAIQNLPPQCKLVMLLALEGLKTSEIAERMKISTETVRDHKARGKKKIAEWFKDKEMLELLYFLLI